MPGLMEPDGVGQLCQHPLGMDPGVEDSSADEDGSVRGNEVSPCPSYLGIRELCAGYKGSEACR